MAYEELFTDLLKAWCPRFPSGFLDGNLGSASVSAAPDSPMLSSKAERCERSVAARSRRACPERSRRDPYSAQVTDVEARKRERPAEIIAAEERYHSAPKKNRHFRPGGELPKNCHSERSEESPSQRTPPPGHAETRRPPTFRNQSIPSLTSSA